MADPADDRSADPDRTRAVDPDDRARPGVIGPFRLIAKLGEGAMGMVYEAEQDRPHRRVALKITRPGIATPGLLRRFEHEYEFLGRLQHPNIAQIYQAGVADTGSGPQPYFAMELVRGRQLDQFARLKELGLRERLELVAQVADAVQHAHHRGVIHRDLKPANILVTEQGQPKILDFGLARAAQAEMQSTLQTIAGEVVGTMSYMSPEQVLGDVTELDTRSDVYTLGVILYEMLGGRLPFDLSRRSLPEAVRVIREDEPARLSSIAPAVPADVETIVAKALEKDKLRRYGSAAEFAEDIRRFLRHEPILARRPSATYQVRKFARRHKGLVGGAVAAFVVLLAGATVSTWQAVRAARAERIAEAEARDARAAQAKAEAVTRFLTDMLSSADPSRAQGQQVTVRAALDAAARKIDEGAMAGQPGVEVAVRTAIGDTYRGLGLLEASERTLQVARGLARRSGEPPLVQASVDTALANVIFERGRYKDAIPFARESLELRRRSLPPDDPLIATSLSDLGGILYMTRDYDEAERVLREALALTRRTVKPDDPQMSIALNNLAFVLEDKGDLAGAEAMFREALAIDRRVLGDSHPELAKKLVNMALLLENEGKCADAEPLVREAVEIRRRVLGPNHPALANALDVLASATLGLGRLQESESLLTEALRIARANFGEAHADTARLHSNLGWLYYAEGRTREAASEYRIAVSTLRQLGVTRFRPARSRAVPPGVCAVVARRPPWRRVERPRGAGARARRA